MNQAPTSPAGGLDESNPWMGPRKTRSTIKRRKVKPDIYFSSWKGLHREFSQINPSALLADGSYQIQPLA
jgi:hypothetical protein